jgi:hypothetical protein
VGEQEDHRSFPRGSGVRGECYRRDERLVDEGVGKDGKVMERCVGGARDDN